MHYSYVLRAPISEDAGSKRTNPRRGLHRSKLSPHTHLLNTTQEDVSSKNQNKRF